MLRFFQFSIISVVSRYIQEMVLWQQQSSRASVVTRLRAGLGQGKGEGQEQRCPCVAINEKYIYVHIASWYSELSSRASGVWRGNQDSRNYLVGIS